MKKIGQYTVRGRAKNVTVERITLFDGSFGTGYRITKFVIAPVSGSAANDVYAKLMTDPVGTSPRQWDWADNREIAWASSNSVTTGVKEQLFSQIDQDNIIVEDLYFVAEDNNDDDINYYIELEKYEFTDWQGALAMVRNKSQG
jgi:6-phosphogluconolactonase/glucosamine-6-phosphate isomerase/deaminase